VQRSSFHAHLLIADGSVADGDRAVASRKVITRISSRRACARIFARHASGSTLAGELR
jgi:hypothetical protein